MATRPGRTRRTVSGLVAALAVLLLAAGCLPASVRPTPPPPPTASPSPSPSPTASPTPGPPTPTPEPTFLVHTVKRGETLLSIAKRYKTDGRSVAYWNRDTYPSLDPESPDYNPDNLKVGWTLRLLPGRAYQPPSDDGETGIKETPTPDDEEDPGSVAPDASAEESGSPAP